MVDDSSSTCAVSVSGKCEPADATTDGPGDRNNVTGAAIDAAGTPDNVTGRCDKETGTDRSCHQLRG